MEVITEKVTINWGPEELVFTVFQSWSGGVRKSAFQFEGTESLRPSVLHHASILHST